MAGKEKERTRGAGSLGGSQRAQDKLLGSYPAAPVFQSVVGAALVTSENTQKTGF